MGVRETDKVHCIQREMNNNRRFNSLSDEIGICVTKASKAGQQHIGCTACEMRGPGRAEHITSSIDRTENGPTTARDGLVKSLGKMSLQR